MLSAHFGDLTFDLKGELDSRGPPQKPYKCFAAED